jgi:hypothetical protein
MKTILLLSLAMLGAIAMTDAFSGWLNPAKQELPTVIIESRPYNEQKQPLCPVVGDGKQSDYKLRTEVTDDNGQPIVMEYIHCRHCQIGALFPVENDPTTGRCSYCHELYKGTFTEEK